PMADIRSYDRRAPAIRVAGDHGVGRAAHAFDGGDAIASPLQLDDPASGGPFRDERILIGGGAEPGESVLASRKQDHGTENRETAEKVHWAEHGKSPREAQAEECFKSVALWHLRLGRNRINSRGDFRFPPLNSSILMRRLALLALGGGLATAIWYST